jgi:CubicO group peptidase (beta-lactamase class C family)
MADQPGGTAPAAWQELNAFVQSQMAAAQVPGVAVGILHQGEVLAAGFGVTNVDHPLPVTDTTLFQIGSITKTFTGTLIMRLVEEGKLDLDAPVRRYVPDFWVQDEDAAARVTLRHLLTHLAGWQGDYFLDTGSGDDALAKYVAAMADLPQNTPVGQHWSYNNAGFYLLGHVIERVTGQSFEQVLQTMVLEPLGAGVSGTHRRDDPPLCRRSLCDTGRTDGDAPLAVGAGGTACGWADHPCP